MSSLKYTIPLKITSIRATVKKKKKYSTGISYINRFKGADSIELRVNIIIEINNAEKPNKVDAFDSKVLFKLTARSKACLNSSSFSIKFSDSLF